MLPIIGSLQPKVGTINIFPQYRSNKLILLKIMKRLILLVLVSLFYSSFAWAGACDTTISSATTSQLVCADDDSLTVTSDGSIAYDDQNAVEAQQHDGVTITNRGTIKTTTDGSDGDRSEEHTSELQSQ